MTEPPADPFHRPTNAELLAIAMTAAGDPGPVETVNDAALLCATALGDDPVGLYAWTPTRVWFGEEYLYGEPYGPRWTSVPRHPGLPGDE